MHMLTSYIHCSLLWVVTVGMDYGAVHLCATNFVQTYVHIDHMSISSREIFNLVKIEGEKGFDIANLTQLPYMELQSLRWCVACLKIGVESG